MSRNSDEFFDDMIKEAAAEENSGDAGNTFAAKMAALESEITTRIDQVEKNLLANLQKEAEAPEKTEEASETVPEESNDESEGN